MEVDAFEELQEEVYALADRLVASAVDVAFEAVLGTLADAVPEEIVVEGDPHIVEEEHLEAQLGSAEIVVEGDPRTVEAVLALVVLVAEAGLASGVVLA